MDEDETPRGYRVEHAKSARSNCSLPGCRKGIAEHEMRLGAVFYSPKFKNEYPKWFHPTCFFREPTHRPRKLTDFEGCSGLSRPEKEYIDKLIRQAAGSASTRRSPDKHAVRHHAGAGSASGAAAAAAQVRDILRTRFSAAVRNNDAAEVRECLALDPTLVDQPVAEGTTALSVAVHKHYDELVSALLAHHANVNATTRRNETALHLACGTGSDKLARMLLDAGADRTVRNIDGRTPAEVAQVAGYPSVAKLVAVRGEQAIDSQPALARVTPVASAATAAAVTVPNAVAAGGPPDILDDQRNLTQSMSPPASPELPSRMRPGPPGGAAVDTPGQRVPQQHNVPRPVTPPPPASPTGMPGRRGGPTPVFTPAAALPIAPTHAAPAPAPASLDHHALGPARLGGTHATAAAAATAAPPTLGAPAPPPGGIMVHASVPAHAPGAIEPGRISTATPHDTELDAFLSLAGVDVASVGAKLREQDIDADLVLQMTESRLLRLGFTMGTAVRLMSAIEKERARRHLAALAPSAPVASGPKSFSTPLPVFDSHPRGVLPVPLVAAAPEAATAAVRGRGEAGPATTSPSRPTGVLAGVPMRLSFVGDGTVTTAGVGAAPPADATSTISSSPLELTAVYYRKRPRDHGRGASAHPSRTLSARAHLLRLTVPGPLTKGACMDHGSSRDSRGAPAGTGQLLDILAPNTAVPGPPAGAPGPGVPGTAAPAAVDDFPVPKQPRIQNGPAAGAERSSLLPAASGAPLLPPTVAASPSRLVGAAPAPTDDLGATQIDDDPSNAVVVPPNASTAAVPHAGAAEPPGGAPSPRSSFDPSQPLHASLWAGILPANGATPSSTPSPAAAVAPGAASAGRDRVPGPSDGSRDSRTGSHGYGQPILAATTPGESAVAVSTGRSASGAGSAGTGAAALAGGAPVLAVDLNATQLGEDDHADADADEGSRDHAPLRPAASKTGGAGAWARPGRASSAAAGKPRPVVATVASTTSTSPSRAPAAVGSSLSRPPTLAPPLPPAPLATTGSSEVVPSSQDLSGGAGLAVAAIGSAGAGLMESQAPLSQFSDLLTDLLNHASIRHYVSSLEPDESRPQMTSADAAAGRPLRIVFRSAVRLRMPSQVVQLLDATRGRPVPGHVRREVAADGGETGESTVLFEPSEPWQAGHHYTVTLNPSAVSVRGATLRPYRWSFSVQP